MGKLRVLIVDDERNSVIPVIQEMEALSDKYQILEVSNFEESKNAIQTFNPEIVILDAMKGNPINQDVDGKPVYEHIWKEKFCPLVIYSADPSAIEIEEADHPFIKKIKKASGSHKEVIVALDEFTSHIEVIRDLESNIHQMMTNSLKNVTKVIYDSFSVAERSDAIRRSCKRQIAAFVDDVNASTGDLQPWEIYIIPPSQRISIGLGDILKRKTEDDKYEYYLVLTPSCDLVNEGGRSCKVEKVLVARCKEISQESYFEKGSVPGKSKAEDKINNILTAGFKDHIMPLPEFPRVVPEMAANFRDLDLIKQSEIYSSNPNYIRIASMDSPFKEIVSWAYIQYAGKPGVPERDFEKWTNLIIKKLYP